MSFVLCKFYEILEKKNGVFYFERLFSELKESGWENRDNLTIYWQACVFFSILRSKSYLLQEDLDEYIIEEYIKQNKLTRDSEIVTINGKLERVFLIYPRKNKIILYGDKEIEIISKEWRISK